MDMNTNAKALVYSRVSTDSQDYQRQVDDLTRYCERFNLEIFENYAEKTSGVKLDRTFLTYVITFFEKNNEVKNLVIQETSRLGRTYEIPLVIERLNAMGVCTHIVSNGLKSLNDDGSENNITMSMLGYQASQNRSEAKVTKYRQKQGIEQRFKRGCWIGNYIPFGYDLFEGKLVENQMEAPILKLMFEKMVNGDGTVKISSWLNTNSIPSKRGGLWCQQSVRGCLKNPTYTGTYTYNGITIQVPQLIDKDTFDTVNENYKHTKKGKHTVNNYLINSRLIVCGECGRNYYPNFRKNNPQINSYRCGSRKRISEGRPTTCTNESINIDKLNKLVLYTIIYNKETRQLIEQELNKNGITPKIEAIEIDIAELNKQLKTLDANEDNLLEYIANGMIGKLKVNQKIGEINAKRDAIQAKIKALEMERKALVKVKREHKDLINMFKSKNNAGLLKENINNIISKIEINKAHPSIRLSSRKNDVINLVRIYTANNSNCITYLSSRYGDVTLRLRDEERGIKALMLLSEIDGVVNLSKIKSPDLQLVQDFAEFFK